ncbi:MAG: 4Fe-4S dicluster domain-containing protein [Burkholderiales bacterium]|nr:4Fe-4S dicluster domain-containing protein [Burkholderiales bacterium]
MAKWGMVIDLDKCTGCQACTTACAMENSRLPGENWQDVLFYSEGRFPNVSIKWFPRPCMHCEHPSCVSACPTRATYKEAEGGFVLIDWNKCIGCKACMVACPYGVRFYTDERPVVAPDIRGVFPGKDGRSWSPPYRGPQDDPSHGVGIQPNGVVSKCTFCYHKVSKAPKGVADLDEHDPATKEFTPACVRMCPPKARYFGDLDNPASTVNKLIADKRGTRLLDHTGNKPQVYYLSGGAAAAVPSSRETNKA